MFGSAEVYLHREASVELGDSIIVGLAQPDQGIIDTRSSNGHLQFG